MKRLEYLLNQPNSIQALKSILQDGYRNSLLSLCHKLGYSDVNSETHGEMITALEDESSKKKIICVPRGCFKSTIVTVCYPIWKLIRDPNETILIDTEIHSNSVTYLREIKAHLESENMTKVFGTFKTDKWNESEIIVAQRNKIKKEASVTAGAIGTTKVGQHYSVICADDYNSPANTNNPERAKKVVDHFRYNLSILNPGGIYIIVGTRYSENDLIGYLLREVLEEQELSEGVIS